MVRIKKLEKVPINVWELILGQRQHFKSEKEWSSQKIRVGKAMYPCRETKLHHHFTPEENQLRMS